MKPVQSRQQWKIGKLTITRTQILCVAAGILLGLMSLVQQNRTSVIQAGNAIRRAEPGQGSDRYELQVSGLGDRRETVKIHVAERSLTKEEAELRFAALMEELPAAICGENETLRHVETRLQLPKTLAGFEEIAISWTPENRALIGTDGRVKNAELTEPAESYLTVRLLSGEHKAEYQIPVTVYPGEQKPEDRLRQLEELIEAADSEQRYADTLVLPDAVGDLEIRYAQKKNYGWLKVMLLGIAAAGLLALKPIQDKKDAQKERELELLLDYSEIVSKLMVYLGAGLTIRNAWMRIAENYIHELENGQCTRRASYEEIFTLCRDLQKGIPEGKAYRAFAERCKLKCYLKLVSILEQNRRNGDGRFEQALQLEVQEAFELRKNTARRLGEEAGTKLTIPLIISMTTIMVIMALPAITSLN